jgi:uncharacterized protein with PIN domain
VKGEFVMMHCPKDKNIKMWEKGFMVQEKIDGTTVKYMDRFFQCPFCNRIIVTGEQKKAMMDAIKFQLPKK